MAVDMFGEVDVAVALAWGRRAQAEKSEAASSSATGTRADADAERETVRFIRGRWERRAGVLLPGSQRNSNPGK